MATQNPADFSKPYYQIIGNTVNTDLIQEQSVASGVTIDGVLIKDGGIAQSYITLSGNLQDLDTAGTAPGNNYFLASTAAGVLAWEDQSTARTSLNVDVAGTDNSTPVTLAGEDYLSLSTQQITANPINPISAVASINEDSK